MQREMPRVMRLDLTSAFETVRPSMMWLRRSHLAFHRTWHYFKFLFVEVFVEVNDPLVLVEHLQGNAGVIGIEKHAFNTHNK